jgi:hypothetical protein
MLPDRRPPDGVQEQRLREMESCIKDLNARIARLAIGMGISLSDATQVTSLMVLRREDAVTTERRHTPDRRQTPRAMPDRRVANRIEELRGLLVLRYEVERRFVDEVGVVTTRRLLIAAEVRMEREGFLPGADGIDLDRLLQVS